MPARKQKVAEPSKKSDTSLVSQDEQVQTEPTVVDQVKTSKGVNEPFPSGASSTQVKSVKINKGTVKFKITTY